MGRGRRRRWTGFWLGLVTVGMMAIAVGWGNWGMESMARESRAIAQDVSISSIGSIGNDAIAALPVKSLLTDPFLQLPGPDSVRVVWFTEFPGDRHWVDWGDRLEHRAVATTRRLSQTREDAQSHLPEAVAARRPAGARVWSRPVWRHEAIVSGLQPGRRVPYRVTSQGGDRAIASDVFSLAPQPRPGQPLKLLLTSDHQLKPMVAANLQQVMATVGPVDGVLFAGDLVNVPDRASEWFDDATGGAFFPCLQGRASRSLHGETYRGGALIQQAPLFPAIGNHEVMGRRGRAIDLNREFYDTVPRWVAQQWAGDRPLEAAELVDRSFNTRTYDEIWTLPPDAADGGYYATSFGDLRLVVLNVTQAWRSPILTAKFGGRYHEGRPHSPIDWGWGQHIFEAIDPGSRQFNWLKDELASPEFQGARYRVVMFHHPPHTLGDNSVPPFADPVQTIERDAAGQVTAVKYEYPRDRDGIAQHLSPLLESAGVDLVLYGHSHLWNRFRQGQTHYLETSNVGNSYGAAWGERARAGLPQVGSGFERPDYVAIGDPNGLAPIVPSLDPFHDPATNAVQPYLASNTITAFSILDTAAGTVTSYAFDPQQPDRPAWPFDRFSLGRGATS